MGMTDAEETTAARRDYPGWIGGQTSEGLKFQLHGVQFRMVHLGDHDGADRVFSGFICASPAYPTTPTAFFSWFQGAYQMSPEPGCPGSTALAANLAAAVDKAKAWTDTPEPWRPAVVLDEAPARNDRWGRLFPPLVTVDADAVATAWNIAAEAVNAAFGVLKAAGLIGADGQLTDAGRALAQDDGGRA